MPRELKPSDHNVFKFKDPTCGDELHIYYRTPTTKERISFKTESFVRKGKKFINKVHEKRQEYALKIITGFRDGDLTIDRKPIGPNHKGWKELIEETCGDILDLIAMAVFEGIDPNDNIEVGFDEGEEVEDEEIPLPKN